MYCLYVAHYPAWAHGRLLRRRAPVVVVSGGRVIAHASSQHLRDIRIGDRADRVEHLCPRAIVRVRDIGLERTCWDDVFREVNLITPFIAQSAPPFLYFSGAGYADVCSLAVRLSAQIGGGENRSAAQLASVRSAEGNVIQLRPSRWVTFLHRFDVDFLAELDFPGDMLEQLRLFGFSTLGDAQRLSERQLGAQFGPDGKRLYDMLHPDANDRIPLYAPPSFIEEWYEFDDPVAAEPGLLEPLIRECLEKAGKRLGPYLCRRIRLGLHLSYESEPRWEGRILSMPRNSTAALYRLTAPLLQDLLLKLYAAAARAGGGARGVMAGGEGSSAETVVRIGIRLESLRTPSPRQTALFDERPDVSGAVREVHRRYPGMMRHAVLHPHALFEEDEMTFQEADSSPG